MTMTPGYMPAEKARTFFTREKLLELFEYDPLAGTLTLRSDRTEVVATNNNGYRWVWIEGAALLVHRVAWRIMTDEDPPKLIDHRDGDKQNNRWGNIRPTDHSMNAQNLRGPMRTNKLGVLGVRRDPRRCKHPFVAEIELDGKKRHIGVFATVQEASAAYLKEKARVHPTAHINQPLAPARALLAGDAL